MADYIVDCSKRKLGRIATEISIILQGKKNPKYNPKDEGEDRAIIKNVEDLELSGNKIDQKVYYSHTTQIGHLKERKIKDVIAKHGKGYILKKAVLKMLPKNRLQAERIKKMIIEK